MRDTSAVTSELQTVVQVGCETSSQFVVDLVQPTFGSSEIEARTFAS